ncbi:MAG TPA: alpha/beta fold hydrolase [Candidatus Saccharimonadales bacterium]|nr:alpha/beta fold hydrolase [Candidatus Saccharimonadales bacterium]
MDLPYTIPEDAIRPLSIYGLKGRVLELGDDNDRRTPILFVYGLHTSLERIYTIAQALAKFGPLSAPDLPGFGGMESLHRVNEEPTIDNFADFLAAFVEQRYPDKNQKIICVGFSLGFPLLTRMIQRHPHLASRVKLMVSLAGFTSVKDCSFNPPTMLALRVSSKILSWQLFAWVFRWVFLQKIVISSIYGAQARNHPKMKGLNRETRKQMINFEVHLWHVNDVSTYFSIVHQMAHLDLTKKRIDLPVHHIAVKQDQYFNNTVVRRNMRKIFTEVTVHYADLPNHAPTIIEDVEGASQFLPGSIRTVLKKASV